MERNETKRNDSTQSYKKKTKLTLYPSRRMNRKHRVLAHLYRALAVDGFPRRIADEGQLIGSDADGMTVSDVELEELVVESPMELIPAPGQPGGRPQRWAGETTQRMQEDVVDYMDGYKSGLHGDKY